MKRVLEPEDATRIVGILEDSGARQLAESKASEQVDQAMTIITSTALSQDGQLALAEFGREILAGRFAA